MDEPRPAHSLKKPVFRRIPRGFLLPAILVLAGAMGLLMLNAYRQSTRIRFQSEAFLQNQLFFLELNLYSSRVLHHYRQQHAEDLKNEPLNGLGG